jgi:hypothetical protein
VTELEPLTQLGWRPTTLLITIRCYRCAGCGHVSRQDTGVQQVTCGHRGRKSDPLYAARRALHAGATLLTEKHEARLEARLEALFAVSEHVEVEATWASTSA